MAQSPIQPGSYIAIRLTDENDPESTLEAYLVRPPEVPPGFEEDSGAEEMSIEDQMLGGSFGTNDPQDFIWVMASAAQFHSIHVVNETGREISS